MKSTLYALGEIAEITMGQSPPSDTYNTQGIGLPFFQGKAEFGKEHPIPVKWCSKPVRIAEAGDILLTVRAPVGPTNIASERCCIGRGLASIRAKPEFALTRYLRFFFKYFEEEIAGKGVGSTFTAINRSDISRLKITLPPLPEQERIVRLLDEAESLRATRERANVRMEQFVPALFQEMFGDPEHTKYDVQTLTELIAPNRPITYGILKPGPDIQNGIPYIRVVDIKYGRLHKDKLRKTTSKIASEYKRSILFSGDVLITIRGTVGRTCIVPDELSGANITQDTARISCGESIDAVYLMGFLDTAWAQGWMQHHVRGQAVQGLNIGDLKRKLPVPLPPLALQREFAARVEEARGVQSAQGKSAERVEALVQSMLSRAFAGEL